MTNSAYRGRLAPSPTGYLHLGHAATFFVAQDRARAANGSLILRVEDIDGARCRAEFRDALIEDLRWAGFDWAEGPDIGGPHAPYLQSERRGLYLDAWRRLRDAGAIYPCKCSRRDVMNSAAAPHDENEEPVYPSTCRPAVPTVFDADQPGDVHWRYRVPDGETLTFFDNCLGVQRAVAGHNFGDFLVWRRDNVPAYQLAVVVDDAAMGVTEVVRGADLTTSTFRQLLLYRELGWSPPAFYHAPLLRDAHGRRLAKRDAALSLRALRETGMKPEELAERIRAAVRAS